MCTACEILNVPEAPATESPRYTHDCERCVFLGHHDNSDLYYCEQGGGAPTLVARYGDQGSDYTSSFYGTTPEINRAREIAASLGLV